MSAPITEPEILCEKRGRAGVILLNRPKALNALTHPMVATMRAALDEWEADAEVTSVVVKGAGEKAFCAGGDIRLLYEAGKAGDITPSLSFWRDEYRLNIRIKRYSKPYVALIDGIVMGGGVGVSLHGSHRVAGDRFSFAMPEVGIGFFPDVGATYALPRLPGEIGTYLALSGARIGPDDAVASGLATHRIPSEGIAEIEARLIAGDAPDDVLPHGVTHAGGPVMAEKATIDRCFAFDDVQAILDELDRVAGEGSDFAAKTAATMRSKAPSSMAIALEQIRRGPSLGFEEAMAAEFRVVSRIAEGHDFYEGVRATIIDKDGKPRWDPPSLSGLPAGFAASHFEPLPGRELGDDP